tara:strand:+ start:5606 stop:6319 length:714 start_codon:yes stop_codon:yes gene_type:complete
MFQLEKNKILRQNYSTTEFPFKNLFENHLKEMNIKDITNLHQVISDVWIPKEKVNYINDQDLKFYEFLYKIDKGYSLDSNEGRGNFLQLYDKFILVIAKNLFNENIIYQSKPTLRVHFPNNMAVGEFHRDRDYNHPVEEINFWVPVTEAFNTNTIWIESDYDKKDFKPMNLNYGQYILFDSGLLHGNRTNVEKSTRISFDFRIIPSSKWKNDKYRNISTIAKNKKFEIGDYFEITNI